MILDAHGKPTRRGDTFVMPDWVVKITANTLHDWEAERRVQELRNSIAFAQAAEDRPLRVGDTIRVRVPRRFAQGKRRARRRSR